MSWEMFLRPIAGDGILSVWKSRGLAERGERLFFSLRHLCLRQSAAAGRARETVAERVPELDLLRRGRIPELFLSADCKRDRVDTVSFYAQPPAGTVASDCGTGKERSRFPDSARISNAPESTGEIKLSLYGKSSVRARMFGAIKIRVGWLTEEFMISVSSAITRAASSRCG